MSHLRHSWPFLLGLAACASDRGRPGWDVAPRAHLPQGALVRVQAQAAAGAPLGEAALEEALLFALEQSPTLDFLVAPAADPGPEPAARVVAVLELLPGSRERWRLGSRVEIQATGIVHPLEIRPLQADPAGLLAAVDAFARSLRCLLGEPAETVGQARPLARGATGDPRALAALGEARRLAAQGRLVAAGEKLEAALAADPSCARARLLLASLLLDAGAIDAAERHLKVAGLSSLSPTDDHRRLRLGHRAGGRAADLKAEAESYLRERPASAEGSFSLGLALNLLGDYRRAEPIWEALAGRLPAAPTPRFQLGLALFGQERYEEALAAWRELEALGADPVPAAFFPALAHLAAGRPAAALATLEDALARAGGRAALRARLRLILAAQALLAGDVPRAEAAANLILKDCQADPVGTHAVWRVAAAFLGWRRRWPEVLAFLEALPLADDLCPEELRLTALWLQGEAALDTASKANPDQAVLHLRECRREGEACLLAARIAEKRGQAAARLFNLEQARRFSPSPWHGYLLARALLDEGRNAEADENLAAATGSLALDLASLDFHPAANPLSAAARLEASRLTAARRGR